MSDLESMDVKLCNYPEENYDVHGEKYENEINSGSNRQDQDIVSNDEEFRSYLNTNLYEISGLNVEIRRAINSEISSQVSRQLEELKFDLNAQILEVIIPAIAEKVLPSIENAMRPTKTASNAKWDLRLDGPHQSEFTPATQKRDLRSDGLHQSQFAQASQNCDLRSGGLHPSEFAHASQKSDLRSDGLHSSKSRQKAKKYDPRSDRRHHSNFSQMAQEPQSNFPKLIKASSNRHNQSRVNSVHSELSDDEGYDIQERNYVPSM